MGPFSISLPGLCFLPIPASIKTRAFRSVEGTTTTLRPKIELYGVLPIWSLATLHESRVKLKQTRSSEVDFTCYLTYHMEIRKREGSRPGKVGSDRQTIQQLSACSISSCSITSCRFIPTGSMPCCSPGLPSSSRLPLHGSSNEITNPLAEVRVPGPIFMLLLLISFPVPYTYSISFVQRW